jgi:hypothetical protein
MLTTAPTIFAHVSADHARPEELRGPSRPGYARRWLSTTEPDPAAGRHPDLVGRDFTTDGPIQLWAADVGFLPTAFR